MAHGPAMRLAAAWIAVCLLGSCQKQQVAPPQQDMAYAPQAVLSDLHLSAEENFLGQQVVYLDGKLTNSGPKVLREVKIKMTFHDVLNQVVLKNEQAILTMASNPLNDHQVREFQIRFDQIPDSWNQTVPEIQVTSIQTQQP